MENRVTIDNLGFHASQRYAIDQKLLEENKSLTHECHVISGQTEINVVSPSFHSKCDVLLCGDKRNLSWALFTQPPDYQEHKKKVFTYEVLPSLSLDRDKDLYIDRIKQRKAERTRQSMDKENDQKQHKEEWKEIREAEEEEKEKSCLLHFIDCISQLGQCILYANIKRVQYHKG